MALVTNSLTSNSALSASLVNRHSQSTCRQWYRAHGTAPGSAPSSRKSRNGHPDRTRGPPGQEGGTGTLPKEVTEAVPVTAQARLTQPSGLTSAAKVSPSLTVGVGQQPIHGESDATAMQAFRSADLQLGGGHLDPAVVHSISS
jgi:hypothetical protein